MKNIWKITVLVLAISFAFAACKKSEEFVNPVFTCDCGSLNWNGTSFQLQMAEYVNPIDTSDYARTYFLTADVTSEDETETHNLNLSFEIENIINSPFLLAEQSIPFSLEEINYNDPFFPMRRFVPYTGVITINPAIFGGTETVELNLLLNEVSSDGIVLNTEIPFNGSFSIEIIN